MTSYTLNRGDGKAIAQLISVWKSCVGGMSEPNQGRDEEGSTSHHHSPILSLTSTFASAAASLMIRFNTICHVCG